MARPALELAGIFRQHGQDYRQMHALPLHQLKLMQAIETCRTAALGGHVEQCGQCDHIRISYNSCRNRHGPKCQGQARAEWLEQRQAELLPVEYFHVVFTLPQAIAAIAYQNKAVVYDILFRATAETLLTIARDPQHLGAEIGFFAVLHTWGQNLHHHPHLHCVVPGGGLSADYDRWIACRPGFFLPVRVLSGLFRRLFLEAIQAAFDPGKLQFFSELEPLRDPKGFSEYLAPLRKSEWVVYAKPPFGGPEQVLAYLGRYTHRVAISNHRLASLEDGRISFHYKDYKDHNRAKTLTLEADEFIRRFLLHALPPHFQRIRNYGFLANANRREKLPLCRRLLTQDLTGLLPAIAPAALPTVASEPEPRRCPVCRVGVMVRIETLPPRRYLDSVSSCAVQIDSS
ncbi:MAG TPA: IS91 family transposase [Terriglobales bacterium]|nr:IS91 family transposase [Terriglobales bacterium]